MSRVILLADYRPVPFGSCASPREAEIVEEFGVEHLAAACLAARIYRREADDLRLAARRELVAGAAYDDVTSEIYAPLWAWRAWCFPPALEMRLAA